jgi:hypothetical protein
MNETKGKKGFRKKKKSGRGKEMRPTLCKYTLLIDATNVILLHELFFFLVLLCYFFPFLCVSEGTTKLAANI